MPGRRNAEEFGALLVKEQSALNCLRSLVAKEDRYQKTFSSNVRLAFAVALVICLFSLPAFSQKVRWFVFGEHERVVNGRVLPLCKPNMLGLKINLGTDLHPELVNYGRGFLKEGQSPEVWCGLLPTSFFAHWPNLIQLCFFTVYRSTGTTVKQAWDGIVGTFMATVNVFLMTQVFNQGAKSYNYVEWICWFDFVLVLWFFLASRVELAAAMFGMSWHIHFMMDFMNPEKGPVLGTWSLGIPGVVAHFDDETTVVNITTLLGAALAVVCTLFPFPHLNIAGVADDALCAASTLDEVWRDATSYMCGGRPSVRRHKLSKRLVQLSQTVDRISCTLKCAWWETFDIGRHGNVRALYELLSVFTRELRDETYCMEASIAAADFSDAHNKFAAALRAPLLDVEDRCMNLLALCCAHCRDGVISADEKDSLTLEVELLLEDQERLLLAFAAGSAMWRGELAPCTTFAYSLSATARRIAELALALPYARKPRKFQTVQCVKQFFVNVWRTDSEHLWFAFCNLVPIVVCFALGVYLDNAVFHRYDATMASTLALLTSFNYGGTFHNNMQRLLGVTLGSVLPYFVVAVVRLVPCSSWAHTMTQTSMVFAYLFVFSYSFYASLQWSFVASLVGGFGIVPLLTPCEAEFTLQHVEKFNAIAQIIIAVLVRMLSDWLLLHQEPRDLAMDELRTVTTQIRSCFVRFFHGDIAGVAENVATARASLEICAALVPKTDPVLDIVPGRRAPFKHELFRDSCRVLRGLLSDLDMLVLAAADWIPFQGFSAMFSDKLLRPSVNLPDLTRTLRKKDAFKCLENQLIASIDEAFQAVVALIHNDPERASLTVASEKTVAAEEFSSMSAMYDELALSGSCAHLHSELPSVVQGATSLTTHRNLAQLTSDKNARLTVVLSALQSAQRHCMELEALCFEHCD